MAVSEADRIKAVERARVAMASTLGGTPSFKRKRAIYRALKRGVIPVVVCYQFELGMLEQMRSINQILMGDYHKR